jgi:uncharacterized repeat protein (TIGR03803 family)
MLRSAATQFVPTLDSISFVLNPNGADPRSQLVFDSSGDLFGTTSDGGTDGNGTVFEIAHGTSSITTLVNFNGANGEHPWAGVILDAAGNLFGTTFGAVAPVATPTPTPAGTPAGDVDSDGTVFEIAHGTNAVTSLAVFDSTNGANPYGDVTLDSNGNLFGTTENGGASDGGTVFEATGASLPR